jgi:cobalamin synthase
MLQALIGPLGNLASSWLQGKADAASAAANLKLVEAEAKATIMKSAATSEADWERIMAQGSQNSWKDEWLTILFSVPLILCFLPFEWAERAVQNGFAALESMPDWYQYTLGVIVAASFGVRSATKFFGGKK